MLTCLFSSPKEGNTSATFRPIAFLELFHCVLSSLVPLFFFFLFGTPRLFVSLLACLSVGWPLFQFVLLLVCLSVCFWYVSSFFFCRLFFCLFGIYFKSFDSTFSFSYVVPFLFYHSFYIFFISFLSCLILESLISIFSTFCSHYYFLLSFYSLFSFSYIFLQYFCSFFSFQLKFIFSPAFFIIFFFCITLHSSFFLYPLFCSFLHTFLLFHSALLCFLFCFLLSSHFSLSLSTDHLLFPFFFHFFPSSLYNTTTASTNNFPIRFSPSS